MIQKEDFGPSCRKTIWVVQGDAEVYSGKIESTCESTRSGKNIQILTREDQIQSVKLDYAFYTEIEAYKKALDVCKDNVSELEGRRVAAINAVGVEIEKLKLIEGKIKNCGTNKSK